MTYGWSAAKWCHDYPFESAADRIFATMRRICEEPLDLAPMLPEAKARLADLLGGDESAVARKVRASAYANGAG